LKLFFSKKDPSEVSDLVLIEKYKSTGDNSYVGDLFERYAHLVYGICLKYYQDRENSKDAVMQIFEKLFISLKEHDIQNFKSWLHVLTKNHCLMDLRKSKNKIPIDSFDYSMDSESFMHHSEEQELEEDIRKLELGMESLTPEQQTCIKLFYLEKRSYIEISNQTGFELKKVKSYIQNGKRNLKLFMEKHSE